MSCTKVIFRTLDKIENISIKKLTNTQDEHKKGQFRTLHQKQNKQKDTVHNKTSYKLLQCYFRYVMISSFCSKLELCEVAYNMRPQYDFC